MHLHDGQVWQQTPFAGSAGIGSGQGTGSQSTSLQSSKRTTMIFTRIIHWLEYSTFINEGETHTIYCTCERLHVSFIVHFTTDLTQDPSQS